jgi:hypothetical protein
MVGYLKSGAKPLVDGWKFDPVHNHWKRGRWLIAVVFNERGTRHLFHLTHKGYSYGDYALSGVSDREAGSFRTLTAAKACADENCFDGDQSENERKGNFV